MRIMIAVPCYWPSQDGVTHITKYLAEGLAQRGHEVLVFTSTGNGGLQKLPKTEEHNGVKIERMRVYVRWPLILRGRDRESSRKAYMNRIQTYQPDVLIVVCAQTWTLDWIMPCLEQIKCPKVFYSHGYSRLMEKYPILEMMKKRNLIGAWIEYKTYCYYKNLYKTIRKFELAIYLFEENNSAKYAEQFKLKNGKILNNAIEDRFFDRDMQHLEDKGNSDSIVRYLYVANYNDNKNQKMLLNAFRAARIGKSALIFAGFEENDYFKQLETEAYELTQEQPDKKVELKIHLTRDEIYQLYKEADVFVCSSKSETASIVLFEAGATAMPVISTNVGLASKIDGILLVETFDEMIRALEDIYHQRELRIQNGKRIKQYVDSTKSRITNKVDWLEEELLELCEGIGYENC